ncbi:MAG: CocE/NonD family hydrolase [Candidatus Heimdallarchaeota archaeon]|nr:MAG: CocE/NonD family hydrolase [Candidatus Heimdallarchaeota archaeon]
MYKILSKITNGKKVSQFGQYQGYSDAIFDGYKRHSKYLTLSDGTRLAYDLLLPTKDGVPADEPLPTLFKYTPYLRAFTIFDADGNFLLGELYDLNWFQKVMLRIRYKTSNQGHLMDAVFNTSWLKILLHHGYAVIVVERPGTGASFGVMDPSFEVGAKQANEILDWIAAQEWCNGYIGMYGDSWQAMIQFAAASTGNSHLKAIFPISSSLDSYSAVNYRGGVYNQTFNTLFSWSISALEVMATPVDDDENGVLMAQARAERSGATVSEKSVEVLKKYPFRDSTTPKGDNVWEGDFALYPFIERINQAGIPIYMTNGWYDLFTGDMFLWYTNLTVPRRLIIRPLDHSEVEGDGSDLDFGAEVHRWFDYWLKGIDNGIMTESPIYYYTINTPKKEAWQPSDLWPLSNQEQIRFYFHSGKTGSVASTNDGFLTLEEPTSPKANDTYRVNYTTTSGENSRWGAVLRASNYPNMRDNDEKALTYTTPPLDGNMEVTGHPVIHLWLTTDSVDLDVFVYMETVDSKGKSTYITEGNLRASHRAINAPPYENLDLPYHRYYESDLEPLTVGEPFELVFDLLPTSYQFKEGDRIRITLAFADTSNFDTPVLDPPPMIKLHRNPSHPSYIGLPVIKK